MGFLLDTCSLDNQVFLTRSVSVSWAFWHQSFIFQFCRAAIWASAKVFSGFYQVDDAASSDASIGRLFVLQAVSTSPLLYVPQVDDFVSLNGLERLS